MQDTHGAGAVTAGTPRLSANSIAQQIASLGPWLAQAGLPFLLVLYLGLRGGGYDVIVRSEIGIAAWWIVLFGVAAGVLPRARIPRGAWIVFGLLAAFALWTALGIAWSESAERSVAEVGRVAALLGVFTLAVCVQGRDGLERTVSGVAAAITTICAVALLSRLHPQWFPALEAPELMPIAQARLHYPINYWNGLAAFAAIGVPLLLAIATSGRSTLLRALALAAVPVLCLTAFFTLSRGGLGEIGVGVALLFALHPRRLSLLLVTAVAAVGSAILVAAANQRDALTDGLTSAAALSQGDEMLAMSLVVCAGVGLLGAAIGLAARYGIGPRPSITPRQAGIGATSAVIVVLIALLAIDAPGRLGNAWEEFKEPTPGRGPERFESLSGSGRYQLWQTAVEANETAPLIGIGPGTYEYYWARHGTRPGFVRDAHSLFLEAAAELGIVGLILALAFIFAPFVVALTRLSRMNPLRRISIAGALSGCAAFATAAAIDWAWELTVLPVAFFLLAAAVLCAREPGEDELPASHRFVRLTLPSLSLVAVVIVAIPMASTEAIGQSQANVQNGTLSDALSEATTAEAIQPYAATPKLQQALVLELRGNLPAAVQAARSATHEEPTNWRTWLVLSRLEAQAGNPGRATAAYRRARSLNPRSRIFQR